MPYVDTGRVSLSFAEAGGGGIPILLLHELGGSSESWREVIALLAPERRVIAVDFRCAGRSEKPIGSFELSDLADDIEALLQSLGIADAVDVIGAALGSLVGALLAIRHPERVRRLMMCAVAPRMAGPTRAYVAERAEKVRLVGMRGVADASLANSFPAGHLEQRVRLSGDLSRQRPRRLCRTVAGVGPVGDDGGRLGIDPSTHSRRLRSARFPMAAWDRSPSRRPNPGC
jgi:pimeloyl-ACP methyl ester carboxylesterase